MKKSIIIFIAIILSGYCFSQNVKVQKFNIENKAFNKAACKYLDSIQNKKVIVLFDNGCCNGLFYFIFQRFDEYPEHLKPYIQTNSKVLKVGKHEVPLITELDYQLFYNQGFENNFGGYLDGSRLGSKNQFVLVMKNKLGKYGRLVDKDELIEH